MESSRDGSKPAIPGLKRTEEFSSLKKSHVYPKKDGRSRPLGLPMPNVAARSTPIKRRPVINGSNRPMSTLDAAGIQKQHQPRSRTDHKPLDAKPLDGKPLDDKPLDGKPLDKPLDAKPLDVKPLDVKQADTKSANTKRATTKRAEPKYTEPKYVDIRKLDNWQKDAPVKWPAQLSYLMHLKPLDSKHPDHVEVSFSGSSYRNFNVGSHTVRVQKIDQLRYKITDHGATMQVIVDSHVWCQFSLEFIHSVELRSLCTRAGIRLHRTGTGRPQATATTASSAKSDTSMLDQPIEVTCMLCDPEPTKGKISGHQVHLMVNKNGVHFDGKLKDNGTFFRKFDFKETDMNFTGHLSGFTSENGMLELKQAGLNSRFVIAFSSKKQYAVVQNALKTRYYKEVVAKNPHRSPLTGSSAAESLRTSGSPVRSAEETAMRRTDPTLTPQRPQPRPSDPVEKDFETIPPETFYSSPTQSSRDSGRRYSKQPRMESSPKEGVKSSYWDAKSKHTFAPNPSAAVKRRKISSLDSHTDGSPTRGNEQDESEELAADNGALIDLSSSPVKRRPSGSAEIDHSSSPSSSPRKLPANSDEPVGVTEDKPSRRQTRRTRRQVNLAEEAYETRVEPTEEETEQLKKEGYRPLKYRFQDGKSVRVNLEDIVRLNPQIYLNDNLIWFYLKLYMERFVEQDPAAADSILLLDTFFYYSMRSIGKDDSVPSWAAKLPFDKKPVVFLPIHESSHWFLAIIVGLDTAIADRTTHTHGGDDESRGNADDTEPRPLSEPTIMILDSLGQSRTYNSMRKVTTALGVTLRSQNRPVLTFKEYRSLKVDIPTQANLTDCGIFLLHYVEQILAQFKHFMSRITETNEKNLAFGPDFWKAEAVHEKRAHLQKELYDLARSESNQLQVEDKDHAETAAANESDDIIEVVEENDRRTRRKRALASSVSANAYTAVDVVNDAVSTTSASDHIAGERTKHSSGSLADNSDKGESSNPQQDALKDSEPNAKPNQTGSISDDYLAPGNETEGTDAVKSPSPSEPRIDELSLTKL